MSEHSAAPWSVSTRNSWRIADPHDNTIASTGTDSAISHDAHKANACLIAAAPDLLEALRLVVGTLDSEEMGEGAPAKEWVASWRSIHETARAAIAKATNG